MLLSEETLPAFNERTGSPNLYGGAAVLLALILIGMCQYADLVRLNASYGLRLGYVITVVAFGFSAIVCLVLAIMRLSGSIYLVAGQDSAEIAWTTNEPVNGGQEEVMVNPVIWVKGLRVPIARVWLSLNCRRGHQKVKLHATDPLRHHLRHWSAWTTDPRGHIHFIDPDNHSRTVHTDAELREVLGIIVNGQRFSPLEADRERAMYLTGKQLADLHKRVETLQRYLDSTKKTVRGKPMDELRRVVGWLFGSEKKAPQWEFLAAHPDFTQIVTEELNIQFGDWARSRAGAVRAATGDRHPDVDSSSGQ